MALRLLLVLLLIALSAAQLVTDSDLQCSACEISSTAIMRTLVAADDKRTIEVGSRLEGTGNNRKSIPYVRSEMHINAIFDNLCTDASLGSHFGGHAQDLSDGRWHFVHENLTAVDQARFGKKFMTGKATVGPQLRKLCAHWLEDHDEKIIKWLRRVDKAGALVTLPASGASFAKDLCHRITKSCKPMPPSAKPSPTPAPTPAPPVPEPTAPAAAAAEPVEPVVADTKAVEGQQSATESKKTDEL
jgi:hypothetical protein